MASGFQVVTKVLPVCAEMWTGVADELRHRFGVPRVRQELSDVLFNNRLSTDIHAVDWVVDSREDE